MRTLQLPEYLENSTVSDIIDFIANFLHQNQLEEVSIENAPIIADTILVESDDDIIISGESPIWLATHTFKSHLGLALRHDERTVPLTAKYFLSATFTRMGDGSVYMRGELIYEISGFNQEYLSIESSSYDDTHMAA